MEHHSHYFPAERKSELEFVASAHAFKGPEFVGQGLTYYVGSDSYPRYIVSIEKAKNGRPVVGIVHGYTEMRAHWTEGSEDCALPGGATDPNTVKPTEFITWSGKYKSGEKKWWYCDENGKKFNGRKARFSWNGANGYQDPSF